MDPTSLPPPPSPPQNPHTPTDAIIEASPEPTTSRSMEDFKARMLKLAGRLLPAHKSLIQQRFDDIIPDEFFVPDHPPYADMILTALWELKSEGGSSEEAISDFIEKEYHDLPWAHTTVLNHHLKDLCMKGRITMKHDKCYILCSSITKPVPSPSSTPPSSPDSSSSASIYSSSSSSSSSLCWASPYRTQKRKRKRKNIRGKRVRVRGRGRGRGTSRGRGRPPVIIQVGKRGSLCDMNEATKQDRYHKEFKIGEESQMEDQNEVTDMEVEDYSAQDGITARISEEQNLPCEQHKIGDKERRQPQKLYNVTWIGRRVRKVKEAERDILEEQSDEVTNLEDDVSGDKNEKENQQSDTGEEQTLGEEETMSAADDKVLPCEAQVAVGSLGKQHDNTAAEEIQPKIHNKEELQIHEQQKGDTEQKILEKTEAEEQIDFLTEKQESKEQSEEQHDDVTNEPIHRNDDSLQFCGQDRLKDVEQSEELHDDFTEESIHWNNDSLQSCEPDQLKNVEQSEEQHDDVTDEPIHRNDDSLQSCGHDQLKNVEKSEEQHDDVTDEPIHQKDDSLQSCGRDQLKDVEQSEELHDDVTEEPIHRNNDSLQSCGPEQLKNVEQSEEQHDDVTDEPIHWNDDSLQSCGHDQLKNVEQSEEQHDDVTDEPIHQNDVSLQSCGQDQLKNVEAESAEDQPQQEEHQTEVCQKETVLGAGTEVQQEEFVEMIEEQNQACIQQTEISEKDPLIEKNDALSDENPASSGSLDHKQQDEQREPLRKRLRSSCKKVDATPKAKKQIEHVTPVRRSLRSHKTISEAPVITEVPDRSKERLKHSGSSKRKPEIAEAEQVSNLRRSTRFMIP